MDGTIQSEHGIATIARRDPDECRLLHVGLVEVRREALGDVPGTEQLYAVQLRTDAIAHLLRGSRWLHTAEATPIAPLAPGASPAWGTGSRMVAG